MAKQYSASRIVLLALPALVLLGYGWFSIATYWSYFDWHAQLRSPQLAALPEDVIGFGFWMWWPFVAMLFAMSLAGALFAIERRLYVAAVLLGAFAAISFADYLLCKRLVRELIRPHVGSPERDVDWNQVQYDAMRIRLVDVNSPSNQQTLDPHDGRHDAQR